MKSIESAAKKSLSPPIKARRIKNNFVSDEFQLKRLSYRELGILIEFLMISFGVFDFFFGSHSLIERINNSTHYQLSARLRSFA